MRGSAFFPARQCRKARVRNAEHGAVDDKSLSMLERCRTCVIPGMAAKSGYESAECRHHNSFAF